MKKSYEMIVFLGNKGQKYARTRHNAAWMLADRFNLNWQTKFNGQWCRDPYLGRTMIFLKPETMMNLSGKAVRAAMDFFKLTPEQILVVHDELELPFGVIDLRHGGGLAGHNGLRSVKAQLTTDDFGRLRIGIGRPPHGDVQRWVLNPFSSSERAELPGLWAEGERRLRSGL